MRSMQKQNLMKLLKCGRVRSVIQEVQEYHKNEEFQEELAISLLSGVSNIVTAGSNVDLETEDINQLCNICCEALKLEISTTNKYKFLCSLYHITKFLLEKDSITTAMKLSNFVFLTRCEIDEKAVCDVYYNYHYLFHGIAVTKKQEYLVGKADLSVMLSVFKHAVKFLGCCTGKFLLHILDRATHFVSGMKLANNEHQLQIVHLQIDILEMTYCTAPERCTEIRDEKVYKLYMSLLSSILYSLFDMQQHLIAQDVVKKTVECVGTWNRKDAVSNECRVFVQDILHLLLARPSDFADKLEDCTRVFESLMIKYKDSKILSWTCITLAHMLLTVNSYWSTQSAEEWNQHMSLHVQRALFNFISCLSELLLTSQCVKCKFPSGEECSVNNDTVSSVNLLLIVMDCVKLSVVNESEGFTMVLPNAKMALKECVARIQTLKQANCPMWKDIWKRCGAKAYNLYVYCHAAGLIHEAKGFLSKVCWTSIKLGEQSVSAENENGILGTRMQFLVHICRDMKNYRGALRVAALGLVILPNFKEKFMQLWAKIKNCALTDKCKDVQTLTVFDILKIDKKIENLSLNIDLEAANFPQLLIWELEAYSISRFLNWPCVQVAYDKFRSLSPKRDILVQGLLAYLPSLWVNGSTEECEETVTSVEKILEALKKEHQYDGKGKEYQCLLGNLHYWLFLCQLRVKRSKQEEEILNSIIIPVKTQSQQEDNHDPLETCDVTPAYRHLNLENETKILETLNKAVVCWTSALQNECGAINDGVNPLSNIEVTAWLYELYGYVTQKSKSWCLYIKYAEALNNPEAKLLGLCHLLEWCKCGMTECKLLTAAEDMTTLLNLESSEEFASQLLFHKYWLARGRHCLRNEKFMELGDCIEKLVVFTKREKIKHLGQCILHVQTKLLISQCKCLPQSHIITWPSKNEKDVFNEASRMYCRAMYLLKQEKMTPAENAQVLSLMLEVSQWLGQFTLEVFWPREARCFMKGDLILAQKLGLATRTAQFLNLLAQVDVMCGNLNDCQVKLQGIEFLLQLESRFQPYDIASKKQEMAADSEIISTLKHLTLDRSARRAGFRNIQSIPVRSSSPCGSPNLRKVAFVLPSFVHHQTDCRCHLCNTLTLQALVLGAVYIQAEVYNIQSELKETLEFFEGGLQLYQLLVCKQRELIRELSTEVHHIVDHHGDYCDGFLPLLHPLKLVCIQMLRGYADFMAAGTSYVQAKKLNAGAVQETENLKLSHPHLAVDVTDQTLFIEQAHVSSLEPKKNKEEHTLQVQEMPRVALASMKTPINTNSLSHRIFRPLSFSNVKIHEHSPIKIKPRKLVLPENDDLEKENKQTMTGTSIKKTRIHTHKQKQSKTVTVFEDSSAVAQLGKLPPSSSRVQKRSTRALRSKTSQKEARHGASEHESLSKVCQALEIRIDSPGGPSEIHQFSAENRKQSFSVNNTKALPTHVIDGNETDAACFVCEGLDVSIRNINNEVFEITDSVPDSEQPGKINREPGASEIGAKLVSVLKTPKLKTYSRQKSTVQFKKCQMSQEDENGGDSVTTVKKTQKTKNTGKQPSSSSKGITKMSPGSSLTAKQTKRRGKPVASYVSMSGSSKSLLQENLNEDLLKDMASINLDSEKLKLGRAGHTIEKGKERKSHRSVKASEFLFTPLRTKASKQHDETIVPSSPDEHLDASKKTTVLPEENKGTERRKKLVFSSSSSSEEKPSNLKTFISSDKDKTLKKVTVLSEENKGTERRKKVVSSSFYSEENPSNLKVCFSSDKDKTLQKMKQRKGASPSKKKQLRPRHPFILN